MLTWTKPGGKPLAIWGPDGSRHNFLQSPPPLINETSVLQRAGHIARTLRSKKSFQSHSFKYTFVLISKTPSGVCVRNAHCLLWYGALSGSKFNLVNLSRLANLIDPSPRMLLSFATCTYSAQFLNVRHSNWINELSESQLRTDYSR